MRAHLDRGKLIPPVSHTDAMARVRQLKVEIQKINAQLADATRALNKTIYPTARAYNQWCEAARATRNLFRSELRQLDAWLLGWAVRKSNDEPLINGVLKLFAELRKDDALEDDELELVAQFEAHFSEAPREGQA